MIPLSYNVFHLCFNRTTSYSWSLKLFPLTLGANGLVPALSAGPHDMFGYEVISQRLACQKMSKGIILSLWEALNSYISLYYIYIL